MSDVALIKSALEFARFETPEMREAVYSYINAVDADLDELGFDSSVATRNALDVLQTQISDAEGENDDGGAIDENEMPYRIVDIEDEEEDAEENTEEVDEDDIEEIDEDTDLDDED